MTSRTIFRADRTICGVWMNSKSYEEILHYLKLDSVFYSRSTMGGTNWGISLSEFEETSMFHIVTRGGCVVEVGNDVIELNAGDLIFMSESKGHTIKSKGAKKSKDLFSYPLKRISKNYETLDQDLDKEELTTILCGVLKITHPAGQLLLKEMPRYILIRHDQHMFGSMMSGIVSLIGVEASSENIGGEEVIKRLADVLVIQAIRKWVEETQEFNGKWLRAIKDEQIGKAMARIHARPEVTWTIESLGREVGMSRTSFSNRFTEVVGESVLSYLTKWRMNLAMMRIKEGEKIDLEFVESLGYKSDSSFRRAFKKVTGKSVSELRAS